MYLDFLQADYSEGCVSPPALRLRRPAGVDNPMRCPCWPVSTRFDSLRTRVLRATVPRTTGTRLTRWGCSGTAAGG